MKENIEKSLRRWLKRKVKITLGLTVSFMITGTVGFASVEGSLTPNENGDINYGIQGEERGYLIYTDKENKEISTSGKINLKVETNFTGTRDTSGGISTKNGTTDINAGKGIDITVKNEKMSKVVGIGGGSNKGTTNLTTKTGDINVTSNSQMYVFGIRGNGETINLISENGNINIKAISTKEPISFGWSAGIENSGNVDLNGKNICVSVSTVGEMNYGIYSIGGKNSLTADEKIEIKSESGKHSSDGLKNEYGENIFKAKDILIESLAFKDDKNEGKNTATSISSVGGANHLIAKNGITLTSKGLDSTRGITSNSSKNILKTETGDIKITSESIQKGTVYGIESIKSITEINSGKDFIIEASGKYMSYGISGVNNSKFSLNSVGNIYMTSASEDNSSLGIFFNSSSEANLTVGKSMIISSASKNGESQGINSNNSKLKLDVEKDLIVNSFGKEKTYGVLSWQNADLIMSSLGDMTVSSQSENGVSTGIYSNGETSILGTRGINIFSKSINESSQGINNTGKITLDSEKEINIVSNGKNGTTYGILSWQNADLTMNSLDDMTISSEAINGASYGVYLQGIGNINSNKNIFISSKGEKISYGVLSKEGVSNIEGKEIVQISSESGEKSYGILSQLKNKLDIKGKEIVVDSNGKKETYGIVLTKNGIENKDSNSLNVNGNLGINAKSSGKEAYGILTRDSILEVNGNTNIVIEGREINQKRAEEMTEEQEQFAKDILEKGNNTIGKIFTTYEDEKVYTGAVNQGIRANNSLVNFNGNLNVSSTDIAMTSIGKNSNITVNGDSTFVGNKYTLDLGKDTPRLIAKPVIQALDGGKITLNGNTGVGSIVNQNHEPHITNVGLYAHGYTDVENTDLRSTIEIFGEANISSDVATMATKGGNIYINQYDGKEKASMSDVNIAGDIVAGRDSEVKISGKDVNIAGDILAGNGGKVTIDLTSENSNFVGRIDDYFDIEDKLGNDTFRDDKYKMDISTGGVVTINMDNNAKWDVKEQSYITNLNFGANGGQVILDEPDGTNSTLSIETISGAGTFSLNLNADKKEKGAMLYIYNASEENLKHTVKLDISKIEDFEVGEEIRFATLGKDAKDKNMSFKVEDIKEEGIKDISFDTGHESYNSQDKENEIYNGDKTTEDKPGEELIEENYKEGENWFLSRKVESSKVNDIGQTIIEMSKSNYASAIYMDNLNKRLGDMTFAEGNEGYWVRVRNDRVGEDEEYKLRNNMTQLGYDKSYPMEEGKGKEYRGLAFEYSKGDMKYKNIIGSADVDRLALWAYDTKMYNDGFYSDYVFRFGRMSSEFDIKGRETGNNVTGDYNNLFAGVSAEFGKRYDISEKTYFEPQIQLQYTYIDDVDYTTNQNTKVEYSDINSLIGRVGFRLGYDYYKENSKDNTIYLKADANHEFLGEQNIKAIDLTGELNERYHNDDTWYDVGIGTAKDLSEDLHIYADVERQFGHKDNSWQFNLGFRWKF